MLATLIIGFFAIAGGGGSGGGGGGGSFHSSSSGSSSTASGEASLWGLIIALVIIAVLAVAFQPTMKRLKKQQELRNKKFDEANIKDPAWTNVLEESVSIFKEHQIDWQNSSLASMKTYMTPEYYAHTVLMIEALKLLQRQNRVDVQSVERDPRLVDIHDSDSDSQDRISVRIAASVKDEIYDTERSEILYSTNFYTIQVYHFARSGSKWLISGISQSTARASSDIESLKKLALRKGYFYSQDWGYLLIPVRGQLFSKASFGVSDINNHVIGKDRDVLFQVYSYSQRPQVGADDYIIAQVAIPKRYDDIVVRKKKRFAGGISGLKKVEMEWGEFNSMYDVFATDPEQATSFELLHPAYMSRLRDLPYEVNIEVVDNIVYLYTPAKGKAISKSELYESLLGLLEEAYRQMRL